MDEKQTPHANGMNVTFSGSDTLAFIILPATPPILLGSLTTFSYSSYRAKKPVNTLGTVLNRGVAKGSRIIAGTFVFTLINQHWVNDLIDEVPWLRDTCEGVVYSDELPVFDVMIISANEYGSHVSMRIQGINLTDEAGTLSINDAYSENTFSFIAREISTFNGTKDILLTDMSYKSHKLFSNFDFKTFDGSDNPGTVNKEWTADETIVNDIKNAIMDLTPEEFDSVVNALIDLDYEIGQVVNNNMEISEDVWDIISNFYPNGDVDITEFLNNMLPYITEDYLNSGNGYSIGSDGDANFYSTSELTGFTSKVQSGSDVVVFSEHQNANGDITLYTDNGWIKKDDLLESPGAKPPGEYTGVGNTNMDTKVFIDNNLITTTGDSISYEGTTVALVSGTLVVIKSKHSYPVRAIANVCSFDGTAINNKKEFIISGETVVDFAWANVSDINTHDVIFIIKELEYDSFFSLKVKTKGGDTLAS